VAIQVTVSGADDEGRREIAIHSRPEGEAAEWVQHASGVLSEQMASTPEPLDTWPPESAGQAEVRHAEVSLSEEQIHEAGRYAIHPALLDAALQATGLAALDGDIEQPSAWQGVVAQGAGASVLRICASFEDGAKSIVAYDQAGAPVFSAGSVETRRLESAELSSVQRRHSLYGVQWQRVARSGVEAPEQEIAEVLTAEGDVPAAGRAAAEDALLLLQEWIGDESKAGARLTFLTHDAIATGEVDDQDLAAAAVWGLVRSAISEHPGRFAVIDTDGSETSKAALPAALALGADEPQLALREGDVFVPRLSRIKADGEAAAGPIDPERTVLITGGLSGLGALVARHLAADYDARHLLLVGRRGPDAPGADELRAELEELGAEVTIAACDVTDREALSELLAAIPAERSLGAVIHSAGTVADGTIENLGAEEIATVFAPKADAAWHLHELTKDEDLSAFVLFSSAAGTLGAPGQGNYAAANVFLDALAQRRRSRGLAATSIAWGLWQREDGMGSSLRDIDLVRMRRGGIETLSDRHGLDLFDAAVDAGFPQVVAVPLYAAGLRAAASVGALPPIFSGIVRVPKGPGVAAGSLAGKLADLPEAEHESYVLDLVRGMVAAVLGHASAGEIEADRAFQELGFDSLAAVELRNGLNLVTGLSLEATAIFDYPNPAALAEHLLSKAGAVDSVDALREGEVKELLGKLEATLTSLAPEDDVRERAGTRLRSMLVGLSGSDPLADEEEDGDDLAAMSDEEMFELIDEEFGRESPDG
jgi:NAD(P)-dependent dehydrogenase (short-subunit alcohol dehydrogenase family)/acyl carrier protein